VILAEKIDRARMPLRLHDKAPQKNAPDIEPERAGTPGRWGTQRSNDMLRPGVGR
jgi:hypothetical protein